VTSAHKTVSLELYCDEILRVALEDDILGGEPEYWDYIGILVVPESKHGILFDQLQNARCLNPENNEWGKCESRCKWHDDNNTEVHYTELDDTRKYKVARSWIDLLLENGRQDWGLIYFYILGLNRSKLDLERFGPRNQQSRDVTIYNRFFRTAIQKSTKSFFHRYDQIVIENIYHDLASAQDHDYFPWHAVWKLGWQDSKLCFGCREVTFISSDHRKSDGHPVHSHFVQFIDLLLGCTFNMLHYASRDENKVEIAMQAKILLGDRLINRPGNKNSRYHYVGRQRIEFFPRENLSTYDADSIVYRMRKLTNFYTKRELRIERRLQPVLPFLARVGELSTQLNKPC